MTKYIDIHSHLNLSQFDADREEVIAGMKESGVSMITVGVDLKTSKEAIVLADANEHIFACIGLHPADNTTESFDPSVYETLAKNPKVVGIGECGLDYYRLKENIEEEKHRQKKEFEAQIVFAVQHDLPLMIHGRPSKGSMDAYEDILEILEKEKGKVRGNVHFFVGTPEIAKRFLALNFTLSFTGVITFARDYDQVIKETPLEMIQAETDSPFAAPIPFRGGRAEPIHVIEVIKKLAELKEVSAEELEKTLWENAGRVFRTH